MRDDTPVSQDGESEHPPDDSSSTAGRSPDSAAAAAAVDAAPFVFSIELLADAVTDPDAHRREWFRVDAHFRPRLHDYWRGRVPHDAERDELINNIWVRTFPNIAKLRAPGMMWNWLRQVGEHAYRDMRRRRATVARRAERAAAADPEDIVGTAPPSALERVAAEEEVNALVERADLTEREELLLRMWARGSPHGEIAEALGLASAAACRKQLERLLKRLRKAAE